MQSISLTTYVTRIRTGTEKMVDNLSTKILFCLFLQLLTIDFCYLIKNNLKKLKTIEEFFVQNN